MADYDGLDVRNIKVMVIRSGVVQQLRYMKVMLIRSGVVQQLRYMITEVDVCGR